MVLSAIVSSLEDENSEFKVICLRALRNCLIFATNIFSKQEEGECILEVVFSNCANPT